MDQVSIHMNDPSAQDVESRVGGPDQPVLLWLGRLQIMMVTDNARERARALAFLQELARHAQHLVTHLTEEVPDIPAPTSPEPDQELTRRAQDEAFEEYIDQLMVEEPPRQIVFTHAAAPGSPAAHTVWDIGDCFVVHFVRDADGTDIEQGSLLVDPSDGINAAVRASTWGPMLSHHERDRPPTDPE